jgi:Putative Ig domain
VSASDGFTTVNQTFTWTVANMLLAFANPGYQKNGGGDDVSLPLSAHGGESTTYTYSSSGLPSGLSLDPSTGLISGTVAPAMSDEELDREIARLAPLLGLTVPMTPEQLREQVRQLRERRDCPNPHCTVVLRHRRGEPEPPMPQDAALCPDCGEPHVLLLEEVVIENRAQAEAFHANPPQTLASSSTTRIGAREAAHGYQQCSVQSRTTQEA